AGVADQRLRGRGVAGVQGHHRVLQILEGAVVVGRLALRLAQAGGAVPLLEGLEPAHHAGVVGRAPAGRAAVQQRQPVDDLGDGLRRLDDPFLAPGRRARHDLAELHVRVHPGGRVEEPGADVQLGALRVGRFAGVVPGQGQVVDRVPGVRPGGQVAGRGDRRAPLPVLVDVRAAVRGVRVRPVVRGEAVVVVLVLADRRGLVHDRPGAGGQLLVRAGGQGREGGLLGRGGRGRDLLPDRGELGAVKNNRLGYRGRPAHARKRGRSDEATEQKYAGDRERAGTYRQHSI